MRRVTLEKHFVTDKPSHINRRLIRIPDVSRPVIDRFRPVITDTIERHLEGLSAAGVNLAIVPNVGTVQGISDHPRRCGSHSRRTTIWPGWFSRGAACCSGTLDRSVGRMRRAALDECFALDEPHSCALQAMGESAVMFSMDRPSRA